jgi:ribosomal subunit interface protein
LKVPLHLSLRNVMPLPSLQPTIRQRVERLDHWTSDVISCHVAVEAEANRHHTGHAYRVRVCVHVPGAEIIAGDHHRDADPFVALHGAFDAVDRQLEDHARRVRGQTKQHPRVRRGSIGFLSESGTGHIRDEDGETWHFDRTLVEHPGFEALTLGQTVRFVEALTRSGREARRINAVHNEVRAGG